MRQSAAVDVRYTAREYFGLVEKGLLQAGDHVELLEGVIVAMSPQNPAHATATTMASRALSRALRGRGVVRVQLPLVLSKRSVPEPDVALVEGMPEDYLDEHPRSALLVIEVADSSLAQDRLSKSRIYAAAEIPEYWLVNLRDMWVETFRDPSRSIRSYRTVARAAANSVLELAALPGVRVRARDLLPRRR